MLSIGLTSLGIIVDRCETPDHIRRMFVAIAKIGAHAKNKRNVVVVNCLCRLPTGMDADPTTIKNIDDLINEVG